MMSSLAQTPAGTTTGNHRRRTVNVCARCHKRKRKCDRRFPKCSGCAQAGVECTGLSNGHGEAPRSIVQFLEQSIAQAEIKLNSSRIGTSTSPQSAAFDIRQPQTHLANALEDGIPRDSATTTVNAYENAVFLARKSGIAQPTAIFDDFPGIPYQAVMLLSTELPLPLSEYQAENGATMCSADSLASQFTPREPVRLPFDVAKRLFEVYLDKILVQNPFFLEDDLRAHFDAVYSNPESRPSEISLFMVSMVLATSTMTSKASDFNKIVILSESLHREALRHCKFLSSSGITTLQGILLLLQFAELLPSTGSLWHLAGEAVCLALQLGLHQDPQDGAGLDFVEIDLRRRIFWTVYCLERSITVTSHRRFMLNDEHINVKFPSEYEDAFIKPEGLIPGGRRTKLQFLNYIRFRQIQAEILAVQFFDRPIPCGTYQNWMVDMEGRLVDWQQGALSQVEAPPDWFRHAVWQCYLMLHRPCPRNLNPSEQSMMACVEAAMGLSKGSWELLRNGYLQYPFHNAHNGFEATTVVLYGLRYHTQLMHHRYGGQNVVELIYQLSGIFELLSERWPAAASIGEFLHNLKKHTMKEFLSITNTSVIPSGLDHTHQIDSIVLHRLWGVEETPRISPNCPQAVDAKPYVFTVDNCEEWLSGAQSSNTSGENYGPVPGPGSDFGDVNWQHSNAFITASRQIQKYYEGQSWSSVEQAQPAKENRASVMDLEILSSTAKLLPSCNRCRTRRIKCEREGLECQNCVDSGSSCVYKDKLLGRDIPCSYIEVLQQRLHSMANCPELKKKHFEVPTISTQVFVQALPNPGNVHVKTSVAGDLARLNLSADEGQSHVNTADTMFFGSTSAVSQMAEQRSTAALQQKDEQPYYKSAHQGLKKLSKQIFREELQPPAESTTTMLLEVFNNSIQVIYHVISQQELDRIRSEVYDVRCNSDSVDYRIFCLVLAVSLQILSQGDPSLSASSTAYFQAATKPSTSCQLYNLQSLRLILLSCVYIIFCPKSGDLWRMVGFASRIYFDIGNTPKRANAEQQEYLQIYQTLYCIDSNLTTAYGRPSQLPEMQGPIIGISPKSNSATTQGLMALYYYNLCKIKSHLHDSLMTKYEDPLRADQSIQKALDSSRYRLHNWNVAWNSEMNTNRRAFTPSDFLSELRSWGNLLYHEINLLLHRYSQIPISPDDRLHAIHNFLQSCNEVYSLTSAMISRYLSEPIVTSASLIYPITWTFGHSIMSAGLDLVKLKDLFTEEYQEQTFRACVTLLSYLETDKNMLLEGFTHALSSLYSPNT